MNLLKTLAAVLTSKEKDLKPYWNSSCLEASQKLLSHTETGCVGLDLNLLNPLQKSTIAESWFSTQISYHRKQNLSTTYYQLFTSSLVECTDLESIVVRSKRIKIYPKSKQLARQYFKLSRWWYNRIINYLKQSDKKSSLYNVRKIVQKKDDDIPEWAIDCPQRIREYTMSDACNAGLLL